MIFFEFDYIVSWSVFGWLFPLSLKIIRFSCLYKPHCPHFFSRPYLFFPTQPFHSLDVCCVSVTDLMLMANANCTRSHTYDQFAAAFLDYARYHLH